MEGEAGDDHRIAFVSTRAGYRHIFTINENSFRLIQLTADFTYDSYPTWSLDGERLAFLRAQEEDSRRLLRTDIYLIDPVGEGHLNLTQGLDRQTTGASPLTLACSGTTSPFRRAMSTWSILGRIRSSRSFKPIPQT
jgi:Tol biopolymer transport system component